MMGNCTPSGTDLPVSSRSVPPLNGGWEQTIARRYVHPVEYMVAIEGLKEAVDIAIGYTTVILKELHTLFARTTK